MSNLNICLFLQIPYYYCPFEHSMSSSTMYNAGTIIMIIYAYKLALPFIKGIGKIQNTHVSLQVMYLGQVILYISTSS